MKPAIKTNNKVYSRSEKDSHDNLAAFFGLKNVKDDQRGFTTNGLDFVPRVEAGKKLDGSKEPLHSSDLAKSKEIVQTPEPEVDVSKKHVIVFDRGGLYTYFAQRLGESFGHVDYYVPDTSAYPESPKSQIGRGLDKIRRINEREYYRSLKKADLVAFPDCYDGEYQNYLREQGHCVFGSGLSERLEIDKVYFLEVLESLELPVAYTELVTGVDELLSYLEGKSDLWIKSLFRGDFETKHYTTMRQFRNWLDQFLLHRLGTSAKTVKMLVQDPIKAECEAGYDGFRVGGICSNQCLIGYEIKDKGIVSKVFDEPPEKIDRFNKAMDPIYTKHGYWGHYSNELRITKNGTVYAIDETCRIPSPPGELMTEIIRSYPEDIWRVANSQFPKFETDYRYGAELILTSPFYDCHEICVEFPKEFDRFVKLKNHTKKNGAYYCVPNGNGAFFGAVVATGKTVKEVTKKCLEIAKEIDCEEFEYDPSTFDKADEQVASGEKFGINF